jgi:Holliday junction resolvase
MNEQALQKKIIKYLESLGYYAIKVVVSSKRGTPDIIACSPTGGFVAIEVKAPGKLRTVSVLQQYNLDLILSKGGKAFACDSMGDLIKYLK